MATTPKHQSPAPWLAKSPKKWNKQKPYFNYQSRKWRNTSKNYRIANPLCARCLDDNKITPATVTDHIKPISQGGDPWSTENYQALCDSCHNKKSRSERGFSKRGNKENK